MEYEIIFYHAGKTAETERLLYKTLTPLSLNRRQSTAATDPSSLAQALKSALMYSDIVVIIGGLDGGSQSTDSILSDILSSGEQAPECRKLVDEDDHIAYYLTAGDQCILLFPDETEVIDSMLQKRLKEELKKKFSLTEQQEYQPDMAALAEELKKELSQQGRERRFFGAELSDRQRRQMRGLLLASGITAAAGLLLLVIAINKKKK